MPVVLHDDDNYEASCASARHAGCVAQRQQRLGLMRKRRTCQLHCTMATTTTTVATKTTKSTVPPYLVRKRTRLSAIVRKRTSCSIKHRRNNQLETSNIDNQCHKDNKSAWTTSCASAPDFSAIVRKGMSFQPSCASPRATASAMGLHKFCIPRASKKAQGKV